MRRNIFLIFLCITGCGLDNSKITSSNDSINFGKLYYDSCMLEFNNNNFEKSLAYINTAIEFHPHNASYYFSRANIYYLNADYINALKDCELYLSTLTDTIDFYNCYYFKGRTLAQLNKFSEALIHLNKTLEIVKAVNITPDSIFIANIYYDRYLIKQKLNDTTGANMDSISANNYGLWIK